VQTISDVYLKRICSLDNSAFSVLEVLEDKLRYIIPLTYLLTLPTSVSAVWPLTLEFSQRAADRQGCGLFPNYFGRLSCYSYAVGIISVVITVCMCVQ